MTDALPLEEINAALRALQAGVLAPDLTEAIREILRQNATHAAAHLTLAQQRLAIGPGVLGLARVVNARAIARERTAVAQAAQEAL